MPSAGPASDLRFTRSPADGPPGAAIAVRSVDTCPPGSTVAIVDLQQRSGDVVTAGGVRLPLDPSGHWSGTIRVGRGAPPGPATLHPICVEERPDGAFVRGGYSTAPFQVTAPFGPDPVVPFVAASASPRSTPRPEPGPPGTTVTVRQAGVPFQATAPPGGNANPPAAGRGGLARTGSSMVPLLGIALWLLSLGACVVVWADRRGGSGRPGRAIPAPGAGWGRG